MMNVKSEFRQPVSIESAPDGKVCEWCGKPAVQQLTVLGGIGHNDSGYFCESCSEKFILMIASDLQRDVLGTRIGEE